jgi:thioesterase domain-containing protein
VPIENYNPQPQQVHIALFKADEQLAQGASGDALGWDKLTDEEVEVCIVPGNHYTVLREPHVRALAERLQACINKVEKVFSV